MNLRTLLSDQVLAQSSVVKAARAKGWKICATQFSKVVRQQKAAPREILAIREALLDLGVPAADIASVAELQMTTSPRSLSSDGPDTDRRLRNATLQAAGPRPRLSSAPAGTPSPSKEG